MEVIIKINGGVTSKDVTPINYKYNRSPYRLFVEDGRMEIVSERKKTIESETVLTGIVQKAILGYFLKTGKCIRISQLENNGVIVNLDIEMAKFDGTKGLVHLKKEKNIEIFINASYKQKSITYNYLIGKAFDKDNFFLTYQRFTYFWLSLNALVSQVAKINSTESTDGNSLRSFSSRTCFGDKNFEFFYGEVNRLGIELMPILSKDTVYKELVAIKSSNPDDINKKLQELIDSDWIERSKDKTEEYEQDPKNNSRQRLKISFYCLVVLFAGYHLRCALFHGSRYESIFMKKKGDSNTDMQRKYVKNVTLLIENFLDKNLIRILKEIQEKEKSGH